MSAPAAPSVPAMPAEVAERSARQRRVVLLAGRAEAFRLLRNPLVLAGAVLAAALIWRNGGTNVPLWWAADIRIGSGLLAAAGGTLIASQLAAGRARRDGMTQLYASYPASAAVRTSGHLLAVAGPLALAAVVTGGAVAWQASRGAVGYPRPDVLAGGVLLVVLAGALGVALGSWLPHPMTGILAAIILGLVEVDLVLTFGGWIQVTGQVGWLFPWYQPSYVLSTLPGIRVPLPPLAHVAELACLTGLAAVAALWQGLTRRRIAAVLAATCLAVVAWSGWSQTRPVPVARLSALVSQVTHPDRFERCERRGGAHYCFYPAFAPMVGRWAPVVDGVLGRLPRQPARALVVRQVADDSNGELLAPPLASLPYLIRGGMARDRRLMSLYSGLQNYLNALYEDPAAIPGSSIPPVYLDLNWGDGSAASASQFGLALSTAFWATRLPTTNSSRYVGPDESTFDLPCYAVGQAREPIALWLAASATPAARRAFRASLSQTRAIRVGRRWLVVHTESLMAPELNLAVTAQGIRLAQAMLRLPAGRVESILAARWPGWLDPAATDAQLAAALRIPLPDAPAPARSMIKLAGVNPPPGPVCR
jgi:hypothetical protein